MRLLLSIGCMIGCLVLLIACGTSAQSGNSTTSSGDTRVQTQTVDGLTIVLEAPAAPQLLDSANFVVTLSDEAGKAVEGADVYLELLMPEMPMGTNKPVASPDGPGKYRAQGVFDMVGKWNITVHANVQGKDHAAMFISDVTEKK